jgi:threonine dehydrogenase-like Zn-dependent dehydrogenase
MIEAAAEWSGGVLRGDHILPMAYPGGIDVVYDTISKKESLEASVSLLKAHGTLVKAGVHGPTSWEWTPLYFKEITWVGSNAFGLEEVDGVRKHGIDHYLDLASSAGSTSDMLTHTFALDDRRAVPTAPRRRTPARSRSCSTSDHEHHRRPSPR